jgi:hypothetical protein
VLGSDHETSNIYGNHYWVTVFWKSIFSAWSASKQQLNSNRVTASVWSMRRSCKHKALLDKFSCGEKVFLVNCIESLLEIIWWRRVGGWMKWLPAWELWEFVELVGELVKHWGYVTVSHCCGKLVAVARDSSRMERKRMFSIGSRYPATTRWRCDCSESKVQQSWVVTKSPINLVTSPNPIYSHSRHVTILCEVCSFLYHKFRYFTAVNIT